ncbi:MAG: type II toxin-antitoxin system VapC family toxin [Chloroflexi bacterium]|nr:type II toxin-antitoxin system VapC family toxin [Chloroflexota bacterium]
MEPSLLDTDILSEILKAKNPLVVERAKQYQAEHARLTISAITVMEIVKGFHQVSRADAIKKFLTNIKSSDVLAFDQSCAETAGRIYGDLDRTGQTVGRADPMIAAIAIQHRLTLVTGNMDHYQRIQKLGYPLRLENWRQAE